MARWAGWVVGMAALALGVAWAAFGWPVLLLGFPLFVGVLTTLGVLAASEHRRTFLARRREFADAHWRRAAERTEHGEVTANGLMSGFFEISPQVPVPPLGGSAIPAPPAPADDPAPADRMPARGWTWPGPQWNGGRPRRPARAASAR